VHDCSVLLVRTTVVVACVIALPFALEAGGRILLAQPGATFAYVRWTCGDHTSSISAADSAGKRRESITKPERCRHFGPDEFGREDHLPTWAPDGKSVAFTRDEKRGVYVWTRGTGERRIDSAAVDLRPVWSPRGDRIALVQRGSLWYTTVRGGRRTYLVRNAPLDAIFQVEWSHDGSKLLFVAGDNNLRIVAADGGRPRVVARDVLTAAWAPDGRRIGYAGDCITLPGDSYDCRLFTVSARGGKAKPFSVRGRDLSLAWDATGKHLLAGTTDKASLRILNVRTGQIRRSLRAWVQFRPTSGPARAALRIARVSRLGKAGAVVRESLALITESGEIKTDVVVPRGWDTQEVAAYIP
jgi:dipeptidyl aminopeptidase/acylaminoacyl peptidase